MLNLVANGPSGYNLTRSLRFRSSASAYLNRTPASASNRTTWTWSGWIKRGALSSLQMIFSAGTSGSSAGLVVLQFSASDTLQFVLDTGTTSYQLNTTQVFRDPSSWYHVVVALDTTQATSTNRMKLYVNGSQVTAFGTATYPSQNDTYAINNTQSHNIGRYYFDGTRFLDGYLTEINFIDGQALTPSSFGSTNATTGVWQPAKYTGTYGTNGYYLPFTDNSGATATTIGKDFSGNSNNWTPNNISVTAGTTYDSMTDVPTLTSATAANYCVLSPLSGDAAPTNGNLYFSGTDKSTLGTVGVSSGKWYFEMTCVSNVATTNLDGIGIGNCSINNSAPDKAFYIYRSNGNKLQNGGANTAYGASFTTGDVIGVAYDADAGSLVFYKNNSSQGTAFTGITGTMLPCIYSRGITSTPTLSVNFGQQPFTYTPPTGYVALNTYNLPTSTIVKGNKYMDATLYTGNGGTLSVTNTASFQPDFVWMKDRTTATTRNHFLFDSVRGASAALYSNLTNAETTSSGVTAFNSNGFTIGGNGNGNFSGDSYVGWQWQAGQGTTSSNTSGSITSTVSVNASAGFSVVTYTGTSANATVGHGLGIAPKMIIFKGRSTTFDWMVYHTSLGNTNYLRFNTTAASAASVSAFNNTSPTSTTFSLGDGSLGNQGSATQVAYCWAEIAGFSSFGSFTANSSADGPFIYTGFRPKYILWKDSSDATNWTVIDTTRSPYNVANLFIRPNTSDAEQTGTLADILSNGFKIRTAVTNTTGSDKYIYAAFAENPFKNALAR